MAWYIRAIYCCVINYPDFKWRKTVLVLRVVLWVDRIQLLPGGGSEMVAQLAASEGLTEPTSRLLPPAAGRCCWLLVGDQAACLSPPQGLGFLGLGAQGSLGECPKSVHFQRLRYHPKCLLGPGPGSPTSLK